MNSVLKVIGQNLLLISQSLASVIEGKDRILHPKCFICIVRHGSQSSSLESKVDVLRHFRCPYHLFPEAKVEVSWLLITVLSGSQYRRVRIYTPGSYKYLREGQNRDHSGLNDFYLKFTIQRKSEYIYQGHISTPEKAKTEDSGLNECVPSA